MRIVKDTNAAVYIPSVYKVVIARANRIMGEKFGGTTNVKAEGTWLDESGKVIKQNVTILRSWYVEKDYPHVSTFILNFAVRIREECKQDNVTVEIGGKMILV